MTYFKFALIFIALVSIGLLWWKKPPLPISSGEKTIKVEYQKDPKKWNQVMRIVIGLHLILILYLIM